MSKGHFLYDFVLAPILLLAVTYPPLAWLLLHTVSSLLLQTWRWNATRRFLVANVALYPFVFVLLWFISDSLFGVSDELEPFVNGVLEGHQQGIEDGVPPEQNNAALGLIFISAPFLGALFVFTLFIGFVYFLASTLAFGRWRFVRIWRAQLAGLCAATLTIAAAYVFRTPIFNWLNL